MSDHFIDELHDGLVEAMGRYEQAPRRRRDARRVRPAALVPITAAVALAVLAFVIVVTLAPEPPPARPHVVGTVEIGGQPVDGTLAGGSLWVSDFEGSVVQIDPAERRVVRRIPVPGNPSAISAGGGAVWVVSEGPGCRGTLVRIDQRTGRIVSKEPVTLPEASSSMPVVAGGGVWVAQGGCHNAVLVRRHDFSGGTSASFSAGTISALAAGAGYVWAVGSNGTLAKVDARTGRVLRRWPGLARLGQVDSAAVPTHNALVVDGRSIWVVTPSGGVIVHVRDGRVVQRVKAPASVRPVLGKAGDDLWTATGDLLSGKNRLVRIDSVSGKVTGTLDLGVKRPYALVPADDRLYVVTGNGEVLFVET